MGDHKKLDSLKEIIWNLLIYVLYYGYCVVILLFFHLLTYSFIHWNWTIQKILIYALIGSTGMMLVRLFRKFNGRK